MKVWIVVPAFNEETKIVQVIEDLKANGYNNVVVVDDGSVDRTYEAAKKTGVTVIKHIVNRGQGAALKTGIDYALLQNAEVIVTFDSDGQHLSSDIKILLRNLKEKKKDIILGSRFINDYSDVPLFRKIFLKCGALLLRMMYDIRLTDSHNGLRALTRYAAQKIEIKSNRMEHASEIIEQIKKKNLKYAEVPVTIKYTEYSLRHGQSTLNAFHIFFKMVINKFLD